MDVASLDTWAITAQALDRLAVSGEITRRQRRDLDVAIDTLDRMLKKRSNKIVRQKYMTDMEEDCVQVCQMGMLTAIRSFDPERGSFSTHVHNQFRAAVGDLKHKMKPESRSVQTIAPVRHVSLFTPLGNDAEDLTICDTIEDAEAETAILDRVGTGMVHLQIDRAYSHYLARSEERCADRLTSPSRVREYRIRKIREREIFVRHVLLAETLEVIASDYGITRERVRQIAAKIYIDPNDPVKPGTKKREPGILNRYLASSHVSEDCPTGYSDVWHEYVVLGWAENGRDIRLAPTALDLAAIAPVAAELDFHADGILPEGADDAVGTVIEDSSEDEPARRGNVVPLFAHDDLPLFAAAADPRRPSIGRRLAAMAAGMAVAGCLASAAAAQTSRAVQQDDFETGVSRIQKADAGSSRPRIRRSAPGDDLAVADAGRIQLPQQAYGVLVATYPDPGALKAAWPGVRSEWNMLQGLHPAALGMSGGRYGLIFGPMTQGQAEGVCHEAKRRPRECAVARFGRAAPSTEGPSSQRADGSDRPHD
jgi:RNA polymerase sigma factor (sigma-70 family)